MSDGHTSLKDGAKCIRLTAMLGEMLEELRSAEDRDDPRHVLVEVYQRAQREVHAAIPDALDAELQRLSFVPTDAASVAELRVAHAQLVGWLEGLLGSMRVTIG